MLVASTDLVFVEEFDAGKRNTARRHVGHGGDRRMQGRQGTGGSSYVRWQRMQAQRHFGNDAQRAFGTDHQMHQIKTG
jgi:hypothetical protein